jgi:hypothetical protein
VVVLLVILVACSGCDAKRLTWRLDTNSNDFRIFPLDVKKPAISPASPTAGGNNVPQSGAAPTQ